MVAADLAVEELLVVGVAGRTDVLADDRALLPVVAPEPLDVEVPEVPEVFEVPEVLDVAAAVPLVVALLAVALVGMTALMAIPVPRAVATPMLSEAARARPRGAACGRRLR